MCAAHSATATTLTHRPLLNLAEQTCLNTAAWNQVNACVEEFLIDSGSSGDVLVSLLLEAKLAVYNVFWYLLFVDLSKLFLRGVALNSF